VYRAQRHRLGEGDHRGAARGTGDGQHHVSLDKAIKTMRETGADMKDKYTGDRQRRPGPERRGVLTGSPPVGVGYFPRPAQ